MKPFTTQYELACYANRSEVIGRFSFLAMNFAGAVQRWENPVDGKHSPFFVAHHGLVTDSESLA